MAQQIQSRNGTAAEWTAANPLLAAGEIGAETSTGRFKIGNGATLWNSLPYAVGMTWKGTWSNATAYAVNDLVNVSGTTYISILAGTNQNPATATTYWSVFALSGTNGTNGTNGTSFTWLGTWSSATTYAANSVVAYGGSSYIALLGANTNQNPVTATTYWQIMAQAGGGGDVTLAGVQTLTNKTITGLASVSTVNDSNGGAYQFGYRQMPPNSQAAGYTLTLADDGKYVYCNGGATATITVPTNASVAFPLGAVVNVINLHSGNVTISTTGITMFQANSSNTGNRILATKGICAMVKLGTDTWIISGAGIS